MMNTVEAPDEDVPLQQGYGLGVLNLLIDRKSVYGHTGTIPGYFGFAMHNPSKGYTIVILSNVYSINQTDVYASLQKVALEYLAN